MVVQRRKNSPNNSKVEVWEMWIPCHTERGRNQGCNQKISWTWQYLKAVLLCKVSRFWSCTFRIFAFFLPKFTSVVFRQAPTFLTHQIFPLFLHPPASGRLKESRWHKGHPTEWQCLGSNGVGVGISLWISRRDSWKLPNIWFHSNKISLKFINRLSALWTMIKHPTLLLALTCERWQDSWNSLRIWWIWCDLCDPDQPKSFVFYICWDSLNSINILHGSPVRLRRRSLDKCFDAMHNLTGPRMEPEITITKNGQMNLERHVTWKSKM